MSLVTEERETWFTDIPDNGGFGFTYKADSNQISFLQMMSTKASQNVTYHCSNSVAYNHNRKNNKRKAIALQSWNDLEIRHRGKFKYDVISGMKKIFFSKTDFILIHKDLRSLNMGLQLP